MLTRSRVKCFCPGSIIKQKTHEILEPEPGWTSDPVWIIPLGFQVGHVRPHLHSEQEFKTSAHHPRYYTWQQNCTWALQEPTWNSWQDKKMCKKKVFASDVTKPPSCENQAHHCYTECTEHKGWYEEMHTVCLMLSLIWTMCKGWHLKPAPLLLFIIKKKIPLSLGELVHKNRLLFVWWTTGPKMYKEDEPVAVNTAAFMSALISKLPLWISSNPLPLWPQ